MCINRKESHVRRRAEINRLFAAAQDEKMDSIEKKADEYAGRMFPKEGMRVEGYFADDLRRMIRDAYAAGCREPEGRIGEGDLVVDKSRVLGLYKRLLDMEREYLDCGMFAVREHIAERRGMLIEVFGSRMFLERFHSERRKTGTGKNIQ